MPSANPSATPANPDLPDASDAPVPEQRSVNTRHQAEDPNTAPDEGVHPQGKNLPKLPHERDQSVDMTDGIPSAQMQQAYRDVERGLVDTDAGREAHNVGNPTRPADPAQPGTPTPAQPSDPARPGTPGPVEPDHR